ncbi:glycosyltransferase involved in cell wall biosynthesis [Thermoflavifilum aggregans]|uniref:Glycosyltransferase involved in cell wall biosynthesis n=1 Tax=Thermoflavifilum aggregans TaxID=454188 RepID=A0A2M9CUP9_9BACT|nr:glycosyltransferase family 4 protein [Thermoflavifilum aggregans]PJJ75652.1 glycosyltransferase involved in cell wall biosynthesis [Thermoflavifilum aggregans]
MDILFVTNVDSYFLSKISLAQAFQQAGHRIIVLCKHTRYQDQIRQHGFEFIHFPFSRRSLNPFRLLYEAFSVSRIYRRVSPDVVILITPRIGLVGSFAHVFYSRTRVFQIITGLGFLFTSSRVSFLSRMVLVYYKFLSRFRRLFFIFQNHDDADLFFRYQICSEATGITVKGSGVDLKKFAYSDPVCYQHQVIFLLASRLLYDKGVMEYIQAAKLLYPEVGNKAKFLIAGSVDHENPMRIPEQELIDSLIPGYIEWIGYQNDMVRLLQSVHVVVLPSYREGLPRILAEAAAVGRPVITCNSVGCRECVMDGYNGFLVEVKDIQGLSEAMKKFISDPSLIATMGYHSRLFAEKEHDMHRNNQQMVDFVNQICSSTCL